MIPTETEEQVLKLLIAAALRHKVSLEDALVEYEGITWGYENNHVVKTDFVTWENRTLYSSDGISKYAQITPRLRR